MKDKILVIGGYGQVGKIICKQLSSAFPGKVIAAGRNLDKANAFASSTNREVIPLQLDVKNPNTSYEILQETCLAIMCLDNNDIEFVKACIEHKTHYIDISPSFQTLTRTESLCDEAVKNGVTLLLGVGLAPGLSNILVKHISSQCEQIEKVDIFLMLGVGEKHGRDGIEWLLNHLSKDFYIFGPTGRKRIKSFSDKKDTLFPGKLGRRKAYRFDIADQHIIPKTQGIQNISTRFCYDSAFVTAEMAFLKKLGIFKLLKYDLMRKYFGIFFEYLLNILEKLKVGSDIYAVKIDAKGINNGIETNCHASILGNNNSKLTAMVTSLAARNMYANSYPSGVYYLEQLFEPNELIEKLKPSVIFSFSTEEEVNTHKNQDALKSMPRKIDTVGHRTNKFSGRKKPRR